MPVVAELFAGIGRGRGQAQGLPLLSVGGAAEGRHKACPYLSLFGGEEGRHKG